VFPTSQFVIKLRLSQSEVFSLDWLTTQPPTLSGTGNEYQPKCGDALWLGSKGRYGLLYLWINVWVALKSVWSLVNTCHTWAL